MLQLTGTVLLRHAGTQSIRPLHLLVGLFSFPKPPLGTERQTPRNMRGGKTWL
jgi:hypothetical protein